jgi:hypothetical protein
MSMVIGRLFINMTKMMEAVGGSLQKQKQETLIFLTIFQQMLVL